MKKTKQKAAPRRRKRRVRWGRVLLATLVPAALITLAVLSLTVFFPIQEIRVKGETVYSSAQILQASGVKKGENLLSLSQAKVERRLSEKLPYIGSVTLERSLPGTLVLAVKPLKPEYAFEVEEGYLLAAGNKALELVREAPTDLPIVRLEMTYQIGKPLDLKEHQGTFERLMAAVDGAGLKGITRIDLKDTTKIRLIYEDRLTLEAGSLENIEKKMKKAQQIIASIDADYNGHARGTIKLQYEDSYFERETASSEATSSAVSSPEAPQGSSEATSSQE